MWGRSRIRTYDFHRVKVQRKGPEEQSKGRNDCTLNIGIVNVRKMELIRDGDFLNDDLRNHRSIFPLKNPFSPSPPPTHTWEFWRSSWARGSLR